MQFFFETSLSKTRQFSILRSSSIMRSSGSSNSYSANGSIYSSTFFSPTLKLRPPRVLRACCLTLKFFLFTPLIHCQIRKSPFSTPKIQLSSIELYRIAIIMLSSCSFAPIVFSIIYQISFQIFSISASQLGPIRSSSIISFGLITSIASKSSRF